MGVANIITISLIIIIVIVIVIAIATGESPREAKSGVRNSDQLWFPHKEVSTWGQWRVHDPVRTMLRRLQAAGAERGGLAARRPRNAGEDDQRRSIRYAQNTTGYSVTPRNACVTLA